MNIFKYVHMHPIYPFKHPKQSAFLIRIKIENKKLVGKFITLQQICLSITNGYTMDNSGLPNIYT